MIKIPSAHFAGRLLLGGLASLAVPLLADHNLAFEQTIQPVLKQYCLDCHSTKKQKGDLELIGISFLGTYGGEGCIAAVR